MTRPVVAIIVMSLAAAGAAACGRATTPTRTLRVCADPNNLPFSNDRREGFENKLADLIAADMHAAVAYTWWAQRRGYVRNTITSGACDVLMGVPTRFERTLNTRPYYRSSYVFLSREDAGLPVASLDDAVLRRVRVGVQLIGDDGENSPPAHALAARRIINNVVGYSVFGDYLRPNPPARIVDAVARGEIDVAVVWGPLAGYFAGKERVPLTLTPVSPEVDRLSVVEGPGLSVVEGPGLSAVEGLPFAFDISIGVARRARALRDEIDGIVERRHADIESLLDAYHVPRVGRAR